MKKQEKLEIHHLKYLMVVVGLFIQFQYFSKANGAELAPGVNEVIRVYIVKKRKINEGDKMAGRHGNKGVISLKYYQEKICHIWQMVRRLTLC